MMDPYVGMVAPVHVLRVLQAILGNEGMDVQSIIMNNLE